MSDPLKATGHSAIVRAQLWVNGRAIGVAQLGPGYLILRDAFETPPTDAVLTFEIDGHEHTRHLQLPRGIATNQRMTPIAAAQVTRSIAG